jgi:hypothetical protein
MVSTQLPIVPVSKDIQILTAGYNGSAFNADVAAHVVAEYESTKRAMLKAYYRAKAYRVGLSLETYCARFNVRGIV